MLSFIWPWAFVLLPLPWLARRFLPPSPSPRSGALKLPFAGRLATAGFSSSAASSPLWQLSFCWLLLLCALARPAWVGEPQTVENQGRDLMLAIDLSGSMEREDMLIGRPVSRLAVVKQAADAFIQRRQSDRLGLVLFSDRAYLQSPLTADRQVVRALLQQASVGLTGQKTAIGDAIAIAIKRLKDRPQGARVLVLLTDGVNNAGVMPPLQAAQLAAELGIRIYTIGVGSDASNGWLQSSELDESTLKSIAQTTGGQYFRASDVQGLAKVYRDIDLLEPIAAEPQLVRPQIALYFWPAALALLIASLLLVRPVFSALSRIKEVAHD